MQWHCYAFAYLSVTTLSAHGAVSALSRYIWDLGGKVVDEKLSPCDMVKEKCQDKKEKTLC